MPALYPERGEVMTWANLARLMWAALAVGWAIRAVQLATGHYTPSDWTITVAMVNAVVLSMKWAIEGGLRR